MKNMPRQALAWLAGAVVLSMALVAGGFFMVIQPKLVAAADAREQVETSGHTMMLLQQKLARLKEQERNMGVYQAELAEIRQALPAAKQESQFVRDANAIAVSSKVTIQGIMPGVPVLVKNAGTAPGAPAPTAGAQPAPAGGQLYSVPITIQLVGSFLQTEDFIRQLQTGIKRAVLIEGIEVTAMGVSQDVRPDGSPAARDELQTVLTGKLFVLTDSGAGLATAAPTAPGANGAPGGASTQTPSTSTSPSPTTTPTGGGQ